MKKIGLFLLAVVMVAGVAGCATSSGTEGNKSFSASYTVVLTQVERPAKATERYGQQKIYDSEDKKYQQSFEDELVRVLWSATRRGISFAIYNKTDHSIRIPWDEAAYVDETGRTHRVMHIGVKYNEKEKPSAPSIIVRKGFLEESVTPTDYVSWVEGTSYSAAKWETRPLLLPDLDFHYGRFNKGLYATLEDFDKVVQQNVGKALQVLIPLQIEDVVNDYIFTFTVKSATTKTLD